MKPARAQHPAVIEILPPAPIIDGVALPALFAPAPDAAKSVLEFFTVSIDNPNTRKAYWKAATDFARWCEQRKEKGPRQLKDVQPVHVAAYIKELQDRIAAPSVKVQLAALRRLFNWLIIGQIIPTNPAAAVRGPSHVVKKGKTPVLTAEEARALLDSIRVLPPEPEQPPEGKTPDRQPLPVGLRDRALIALLTYTFARVGAAVAMRVQDVYTQGRRTWVRLHEKGGKRHEMPCHHKLEEYLHIYIESASLGAGRTLGDDPKGWLFRTTEGQSGYLTDRPMTRNDVYRMVRRRAGAAGIETEIGCHTFRATGITDYLRNGGKLEIAQQMANHESARTTGLYDRRNDQVSLDEVERILI